MDLDKCIHSYTAVVVVPFGQSDERECRRVINRHHGFASGTVPDDDKITPELSNAHHKLNAVQQQLITVDVFADGTRRISYIAQ